MPSSYSPSLSTQHHQPFSRLLNSKPKVLSPLSIELKVGTVMEQETASFSMSPTPQENILNHPTRLLGIFAFVLECLLNGIFVLGLLHQSDPSWHPQYLKLACVHELVGSQLPGPTTVLAGFMTLATLSSLLQSNWQNYLSFGRMMRTATAYLFATFLSIRLPGSTRIILELVAWIDLGLLVQIFYTGSMKMVQMVVELDDPYLSSASPSPPFDLPLLHGPHTINVKPKFLNHPVSPLMAYIIKKRYHHLLNSC